MHQWDSVYMHIAKSPCYMYVGIPYGSLGFSIFMTYTWDIHLFSTELIEGQFLTPICHSQNVIVLIPEKIQQKGLKV